MSGGAAWHRDPECSSKRPRHRNRRMWLTTSRLSPHTAARARRFTGGTDVRTILIAGAQRLQPPPRLASGLTWKAASRG